MKILANWLFEGGRDYALGVALFEKLRIDPKKNLFFKVSKPDKIRVSMLSQMLNNYARIHRIKPQAAAVAYVTPSKTAQVKQQPVAEKRKLPVIDKNPHINYDELPDDYKAIYNKSGELTREMKSFHNKLKLIATDPQQAEARAELCSLILQHDSVIRANYKVIDEWFLSGKISQPVVVVNEPFMSDLEKDRRIKANLNYIRRYHDDPAKQQEVKIRMSELDNWQISYEKLLTRSSG